MVSAATWRGPYQRVNAANLMNGGLRAAVNRGPDRHSRQYRAIQIGLSRCRVGGVHAENGEAQLLVGTHGGGVV